AATIGAHLDAVVCSEASARRRPRTLAGETSAGIGREAEQARLPAFHGHAGEHAAPLIARGSHVARAMHVRALDLVACLVALLGSRHCEGGTVAALDPDSDTIVIECTLGSPPGPLEPRQFRRAADTPSDDDDQCNASPHHPCSPSMAR